MRTPPGALSALRLAALGCSSLLAACAGSASDQSLMDPPSEAAPAVDEARAEPSSASPAEAGSEASIPRPTPVDIAAQPPPHRAICEPTLTASPIFQSRAELETLAGCEVLRGFEQIHIAEGVELTPLASLRVVEGSLMIGSNPSVPSDNAPRLPAAPPRRPPGAARSHGRPDACDAGLTRQDHEALRATHHARGSARAGSTRERDVQDADRVDRELVGDGAAAARFGVG